MKSFLVVLLIGCLLTTYNYKNPVPKNVAKAEYNLVEAATKNKISEPLSIHHFVKGNSVFVECYLKDYSFSNHDQKPQTIVHVYLDDEKVKEANTAAFIIKDVPVGSHQVRLVIRNNGQKVDLIKQFKVHISSTI